MTELENSLRDQLAESEQRHQEQMASLHARHKEEIAEALAEAKRESDAWHEQQLAEEKRESKTRHEQQMAEAKREMAEAKRQMDEMMLGMRAIQEAKLQSNVCSLSNFSGNKNFAFNLMKLTCLLQCIVTCY